MWKLQKFVVILRTLCRTLKIVTKLTNFHANYRFGQSKRYIIRVNILKNINEIRLNSWTK